MARDTTTGQFTKDTRPYRVTTWFERDRAHIVLIRPNGTEVFNLWDEDVFDAIESGYLPRPRRPRPQDDDWLESALSYARDMGLISD